MPPAKKFTKEERISENNLFPILTLSSIIALTLLVAIFLWRFEIIIECCTKNDFSWLKLQQIIQNIADWGTRSLGMYFIIKKIRDWFFSSKQTK